MVFLAKTITIPSWSKFYHRSGLVGAVLKKSTSPEKEFIELSHPATINDAPVQIKRKKPEEFKLWKGQLQ